MEWVARSFAYYLAKGIFWRCMGKDNKLIKITSFNTELNRWLGTEFESFEIYRSKGLLTHLINPEVPSFYTKDYVGAGISISS